MIARALTLGYKGTVVLLYTRQPDSHTSCRHYHRAVRVLSLRADHLLTGLRADPRLTHCGFPLIVVPAAPDEHSRSSHPTQCASSPVVTVELHPHTPATPLITTNPYFLKRYLALSAQETH